MRHRWKPAISHAESPALHTPAQQAIHLALPGGWKVKTWPSAMVDLLTEAKSFAAEGTGFS
ncbi:hypothetical protein [Escherichia coli]|uniref:hypothetical protein n=1 Tax=Escherichia coli TaxID=562 RepID=UPI003D9A1F02